MWGANRIRYPGSPHRKRWILDVGGDKPSVEYDRKVETQRN